MKEKECSKNVKNALAILIADFIETCLEEDVSPLERIGAHTLIIDDIKVTIRIELDEVDTE